MSWANVRDLGKERDDIYYFFQSIVCERVERSGKCGFVREGKIVRVYIGACYAVEKVEKVDCFAVHRFSHINTN